MNEGSRLYIMTKSVIYMKVDKVLSFVNCKCRYVQQTMVHYATRAVKNMFTEK